MRNASLELLSVNTSQDETIEIADECFLNDPLQTKIGRVLLYGVLIVLSIAGNSLIITAVRNDKNTKPTVRLFIQNMSAADLLITLIYMPRMISIMFRGYEWLVDGLLGLILCKFVTVIHHTAIFVSIQTLVVLSVERFVAVAYPLKRNISKRLAKRLIAAMWLGSLVVRIPRVVALYTERNKYGTLICTSRKRFDEYFENAKVIYYDLLFYVFYLIPLVIIAFSYSAILFTLKRRTIPGCQLSREQRRHEILNRKVFRMLLAVTLAFILCWFMYFVKRKLPEIFPCDLEFWRRFTAHSNTVITPMIYFAFNDTFRKQAKRTFAVVTKMFDSAVDCSVRGKVSSRGTKSLHCNYSRKCSDTQKKVLLRVYYKRSDSLRD